MGWLHKTTTALWNLRTLRLSISQVSETVPLHSALLKSTSILCVFNDNVRYNNLIKFDWLLALTPILPSWETFPKAVQMMVEHPPLSECLSGYQRESQQRWDPDFLQWDGFTRLPLHWTGLTFDLKNAQIVPRLQKSGIVKFCHVTSEMPNEHFCWCWAVLKTEVQFQW